jgi:hypothetical protein
VVAPDIVDVRRLRRAAFVAGLGDGVAAVALPLLAANLTRDPLAVAGVVAAQHLPWPLLVLLLPVLRRTDRRTLAGAGDSLRAVAVAAAGLLTVVGDETITTLVLVALALGLAQALRDEAERVGGETRQDRSGDPATGAIAVAGMLGMAVVGLPLGGVLYELLAPIPLLFDVGVFAVAALLVLAVRQPLREDDDGGDPGRAPWLPRPARGSGVVTAAAGVAALAAGAVAGVLVLVALDDLGLGAPAFGLLLTGLAVAAAAGGLVAPAVGQALGVRGGAVLALVAAAAGQVAAWALLDPDRPYPSVAALGVAAAAAAAAGVLLRAQRRSRPGVDDARGFHLVVWAATPAGAMAGGVGARIFDPGDVLVIGAVGALVAAAVALMARPPAPAATAAAGALAEMP